MFKTLKALLLLAAVAGSPAAFAYIDPNAGGFLFQLLAPVLAAFVGAWVFLRRWISQFLRDTWRSVTALFRR